MSSFALARNRPSGLNASAFANPGAMLNGEPLTCVSAPVILSTENTYIAIFASSATTRNLPFGLNAATTGDTPTENGDPGTSETVARACGDPVARALASPQPLTQRRRVVSQHPDRKLRASASPRLTAFEGRHPRWPVAAVRDPGEGPARHTRQRDPRRHPAQPRHEHERYSLSPPATIKLPGDARPGRPHQCRSLDSAASRPHCDRSAAISLALPPIRRSAPISPTCPTACASCARHAGSRCGSRSSRRVSFRRGGIASRADHTQRGLRTRLASAESDEIRESEGVVHNGGEEMIFLSWKSLLDVLSVMAR